MAGFTFKQFSIEQARTAMKVSTDGILLGAWVGLDGVNSMLDIGAGTGLLSLMCKQRAELLTVTAVEIDTGAYEDAKQNILNSPWNEEIVLHHMAIQELHSSDKFDLIISNPPYFNNSLKSHSLSRNLARHTDSLSFKELLNAFKRFSHQHSRLAIVLPCSQGDIFIQLAQQEGVKLTRQCDVKTTEQKMKSRVLLEFVHNKDTLPNELKFNTLCVHKNGQYSDEFIRLCKDFYLKM